tara:strand:- start:169759 stop:170583 length:825 start_codon:yes stop_codon:yes gene_type:complete
MKWTDKAQALLTPPVDTLSGLIPSAKPNSEQLKRTKIIAHRGDHKKFIENTMEAFLSCYHMGLDGIEFDIQWTKDLVPVIHHDRTTGRIFTDRPDHMICETPLDDLRQTFPEIPTLDEVVQKLGKKLHLMIEIKPQPRFNSNEIHQCQLRLEEILKPLKAGQDFHFLFFNLQRQEFLAKGFLKASFLIAEINLGWQAETAMKMEMAGLCGHYALMVASTRQFLKEHKMLTGVGYPANKNTYFRECLRGTDFVFTNDPEKLVKAKISLKTPPSTE